MAKKNDDINGVWRTIGGRRVFIKDGQSLSDAMKASGKFNKKKSPVVENAPDEVADYLYKETGRDIVSKTEIDDFIREDFLDDELRDYRDKVTEAEYKAVYKELERMGYKIDYDEDDIKGPSSKEVKEINDKVTKDWGSSELEDTRKALASAERYLEKHPDDERMKKRVELHKKDIERLEKQESSGNKNRKNIEEDIAKEKADYYKNKAEEYKNTKDPMFEDIKGKRAEEYQQKWEEEMKNKYPTRDVKDYQDKNGMWHINDTAKDQIDNDVSKMSGKELKEAYKSLEKDDNSYEARAIRGEYNLRQSNEEKFHKTTESMKKSGSSNSDSFTMTNGSREVTVSKDDSGKWVDSDGNKYMGYLSKSDVKSYFKGDWKEAKPETKNNTNNTISEKQKQIRHLEKTLSDAYKNETPKYRASSLESKRLANISKRIHELKEDVKKEKTTNQTMNDAIREKAGLSKSTAGLNTIDKIAGNDEKLQRLGREMGASSFSRWEKSFREYMKEHPNSKLDLYKYIKMNTD